MRATSCIVAVAIALGSCQLLRASGLEPTDGFFNASDGVKIHYIELSPAKPAGAPVILIHGYTGTAHGNWFLNGIADALAAKHRVVAIDCRGHGKSEKPHDASKYGPQMSQDVFELMDHLKIDKAHVHGYSMGGFIVTQLLAKHPERFLTAAYGGSGVPETDASEKANVPADKSGPDPQEADARKKLGASPDRDEAALKAVREYKWKPEDRGQIDLTKIKIPVLAINGEFDGPNAKTHRMQRELANFKAVVLPGKSHLTAIMAGYMPKEYVVALVEFIDANDRKQ
jgi:pimeloyl-ACP methyl ester carboxylesterase